MKDLEIVCDALYKAKKFGLEADFVLCLIRNMKENPLLTVEELLNISLSAIVK